MNLDLDLTPVPVSDDLAKAMQDLDDNPPSYSDMTRAAGTNSDPSAAAARDQRRPLYEVLPPIIFGTGTFNTQFHKDPYSLGTNGLIQEALSFGLRAFDTSPYYGPSEELLGAALDTAEVRAKYSRGDYFLLSKVGRIAGDEFDYSPEWVQQSIRKSLERLRTSYLDVVYCHDVEFVTEEEAIGAVKELRRIRDDEGTVKYVGISGYPLDVLCRIAALVKNETGEPLDAVMSYAHFTLQNTELATDALAKLTDAGVGVVPNASPLSMGLLRRVGPAVGQVDFHPAGKELRDAVRACSDFCDAHDERLEVIALRYALDEWARVGSPVGTLGDPASSLPWKQAAELLGDQRIGVSVVGFSTIPELQSAMRIWHNVLDGMENGQKVADAAGRWKREHEWSVNRQAGVGLIAEGVKSLLGHWFNYNWASPPTDFVRVRKRKRSPDQ